VAASAAEREPVMVSVTGWVVVVPVVGRWPGPYHRREVLDVLADANRHEDGDAVKEAVAVLWPEPAGSLEAVDRYDQVGAVLGRLAYAPSAMAPTQALPSPAIPMTISRAPQMLAQAAWLAGFGGTAVQPWSPTDQARITQSDLTAVDAVPAWVMSTKVVVVCGDDDDFGVGVGFTAGERLRKSQERMDKAIQQKRLTKDTGNDPYAIFFGRYSTNRMPIERHCHELRFTKVWRQVTRQVQPRIASHPSPGKVSGSNPSDAYEEFTVTSKQGTIVSQRLPLRIHLIEILVATVEINNNGRAYIATDNQVPALHWFANTPHPCRVKDCEPGRTKQMLTRLQIHEPDSPRLVV
jgi:hypothetical protein